VLEYHPGPGNVAAAYTASLWPSMAL
jgi:hypothetical protein